MRILIVEDDLIIAKIIAKKLQEYDYATQIVEDFTKVMEVFEQFHPHLILLDINLSFYNGYYCVVKYEWCQTCRLFLFHH